MRNLNILSLVVFLIAVILSGCIEYDQETVINEDGSGTVKIHYNTMAQDPIEDGAKRGSMMDNVPMLPFSEEEIIKSYEGAPVRVYDVKLETIDGKPNATYYIDFANINDLNGVGIFSLENGKLTQSFSIEKDGEDYSYNHEIAFDWSVEDTSSLSGYEFTYEAKFPGELLETNGISGPDNSVKWAYTLDELVNNKKSVNAKYNIPKPVPIIGSTKKIGKTVGWTVGIIISCVLVIVPIILGITKKKKPLFMYKIIENLESGSAFKNVVGVVLFAYAVVVALAGIVTFFLIWSVGMDTVGFSKYLLSAYSIIFGIFIYMIVHATVIRAKSILELTERDYFIIPILSKVLKLGGEVLACYLIAGAILWGGIGFYNILSRETTFGLKGNEPLIYLGVAASEVFLAFAFLMVSYLLAELLNVFVDIASNTSALRHKENPTTLESKHPPNPNP